MSTTTPSHEDKTQASLSFSRMDIERRLSLPAGKFTQPGPVLAPLLAVILSLGFYGALMLVGESWLRQSFTERGYIPYAIVLFSNWALSLIYVKYMKVRLQRRALDHHVIPDNPEFILSTATVAQVLDRLYDIAQEPRDFILYNRIQFALSNLKNIGRIGDVDEILRSRAENDESAAESGYTVLRGLIWAIPVLGFIGTVIGLSVAIGSFGTVLNSSTSMDEIKPALQLVTGGLSTAFETTLQALLAALVIQLLMTIVKRSEEQMLDGYNDFCDRQIVGRLRLQTENVS